MCSVNGECVCSLLVKAMGVLLCILKEKASADKDDDASLIVFPWKRLAHTNVNY